MLTSIFYLLLDTGFDNSDKPFVHSVVVSFVDFSLNEATLFEQIIGGLASISPLQLLLILCSCCRFELQCLLSSLTKAMKTWNCGQKKKFFTSENCFDLLEVCIKESTSQMFRFCAQLLTEVSEFDLQATVKTSSFGGTKASLLHMAAEAANYEAVEHLVNRVSLEIPTVLKDCTEDSYENDLDVIRQKENILHLILKKDPTLLKKIPDILVEYNMHLALFKVLVKFGANLTAVDDGKNCVMVAARYMSSSDFHEVVQFLLFDFKAEYLFLDNEKWKDPVPYIIQFVALLPETLELLLHIPGMDINMRDLHGENLLSSAVKGNKVSNLEQLVKLGVDYKARGGRNRSLLHLAAFCGEQEMINCLLSLKMDPNSRDINEWTPLHYAAYKNRLPVSVVEVLVENGANVRVKNTDGQTALHLSAQNYDECGDKMRYLIRNGVGVNDRDDSDNTPLHLCRILKNKDCLLQMGADIQAKNKTDETPAQMNPDFWK